MANVIRCVVLLTVYAMTALARDHQGRPALNILLAAAAVYTLATTIMARSRPLARRTSLAITSLDVVLVTCLVWMTGGLRSQYYVVYYLPVLHASLRLNFRDAVGSAALAAAFYAFMGVAAPEQVASATEAVARIGTFGSSSGILAAFFALTARQVRLHREAEQRMRATVDRLAAVYDVGHTATKGGSVTDILNALVTQATMLCDAKATTAALLNGDGSMKVMARAHSGSDDPSLVLDRALAAQASASFAPAFRSAHEAGPEAGASVCIPLRSNGRALGALQAWCPPGRAFRQPAVDLLTALCAEACIGLENVRLRAELASTAATDYLTQLPNRREFERLLDQETRRCNSRKTPLAMVLLDVDDFKMCNDAKGHTAGDEVLRALAAAIQEAATHEDAAARYGGDEFALLLPGKNAEQAAQVAETVRKNFAMRLRATDESMAHITVSAGVGCLRDSEDAHELVQEADRAVLFAKRMGRDQVCAAHQCAGQE